MSYNINLIDPRLRTFVELKRIQEELKIRKERGKLSTYYPESGPFSREKYIKHINFFKAKTREKILFGGNRVGKTFCAAYETALHLTGLYEDWWREEDGFKRFKGPTDGWVAGDTVVSTRDIIQEKLLGNIKFNGRKKWVDGTGMIPYDLIERITWKRGAEDAIDKVFIRHVSGKRSILGFRAYEQGRKQFQGTAKHFIWFDEEPKDIATYNEALLRTTTTDGIIYTTFTPLSGMNEVVLSFIPDAAIVEGENEDGTKTVISMTWDETPHIDDATKEMILKGKSENERQARMNGIPSLGSGLVYPIKEEEYVIPPFQIPDYYYRAYGMDVGWRCTAALWGAYDRDSKVMYIYSEHAKGEQTPHEHSHAIKQRGEWIQGVIDPASRQRGQRDGQQLLTDYLGHGLKLSVAENGVEAGVMTVLEMFQQGRLKVFSNCQGLIKELRNYRRDDEGDIIKANDHLCLAGGTEIITDKGVYKIEELVGTTGKIINRYGQWEDYSVCAMTGENKEVVKVTFSDGSEVTCTPNHEFLIDDLWTKAVDLVGKECDTRISQSIKENLCEYKYTLPQNKHSTVEIITSAENISKNVVETNHNIFTEKFLNTSMVKYLKAIMFTMLTKTLPTIKSKISNVFLQKNTWNIITELLKKENTQEKTYTKQSKKLLNGMARRKVLNGTKNIMRISKKNFMRKLNALVMSVENYMTQIAKQPILSVQTPVKLNGEKYKGWTTNKEFVDSAVQYSPQINTLRKSAVQNYAEVSCLSVQKANNENVYCLYVPETHSFTLANGIVSKNCDSLRYLCVSGISKAKQPPNLNVHIQHKNPNYLASKLKEKSRRVRGS